MSLTKKFSIFVICLIAVLPYIQFFTTGNSFLLTKNTEEVVEGDICLIYNDNVYCFILE